MIIIKCKPSFLHPLAPLKVAVVELSPSSASFLWLKSSNKPFDLPFRATFKRANIVFGECFLHHILSQLRDWHGRIHINWQKLSITLDKKISIEAVMILVSVAGERSYQARHRYLQISFDLSAHVGGRFFSLKVLWRNERKPKNLASETRYQQLEATSVLTNFWRQLWKSRRRSLALNTYIESWRCWFLLWRQR